MSKGYSKLFERTYIGNMGVKNRFALAPMGTGLGSDGLIDDDGLEYYTERAKGGVGLLILGFQNVTRVTDPAARTYYGVGTPLQEMSWARVADRVHGYGTKIMAQLSIGLGRCGIPGYGDDYVSASENPVYYEPDKMTRPLTREEIHQAVKDYGVAAAACKRAGMDAIEIHAHFGYLLDQFMTKKWNRREDEYGTQNFENQTRLITEIYEATRSAVGKDYPIVVRMVTDHMIPDGRGKEESAEIIRYLDQLGVDAFDLDVGCYDIKDWCFPTHYLGDGCMADLAGAYGKTLTDKPIMTVGSYTPQTALEAVESGKSDFILLGRGMLADPHFVNKLCYGHPEDIRPCIKCNRFCLGGAGYVDSSCAVNPACFKEKKYGTINMSKITRKVTVIGGGIAGMEAARVAAIKGHDVTIYDKADQLGGQLIPAMDPPFKSRLSNLLDYYKVQMDKLGVHIELNHEINADSTELANAHTIIVATGAHPFKPPIEGVENDKIMDVIEAHLEGRECIGQKVLVAGGGASGCDIAIELAQEGKDVILVEMLDQVDATGTIEDRFSIHRLLKKYNVDVLTGTKIRKFNDQGAVVQNSEGRQQLPADTIIVAMGMHPNIEPGKAILDKYTNAVMVGDCTKVAQIGEAVREGFFAGLAVD
jgi:2,4-dienoyl-CoA reductase-like NADH-dependent reductase (Old Yellow Enzyme family)/thioredoxin reductase